MLNKKATKEKSSKMIKSLQFKEKRTKKICLTYLFQQQKNKTRT